MRSIRFHICLLTMLGGLLCGTAAQAQPDLHAVVSRMDARLKVASQQGDFSGVVFVGKGDEVLLNKGYGWANPNKREANSPEKRFMIASVSKAFAAAAILQLEDQGLLKVSDPISKHLPDYPAWAGDAITIHHLLTHTSGIPDYINDYPLEFKFRQLLGWNPGKEELIRTFQDRALNFYPGERFRYSNSGYVLLARIVEDITGEDYDTYLWKNILRPLEMNSTGLGDFNMIGNRSVAYKGNISHSRMIRNFNHQWIYGMGEMYATALDLNRWLQSFNDTLILSRTAQEKMFRPVRNGYAYGWHVGELYGHTHYSHGGYLPGWNSHVFFFPKERVSVIVLSNNEDADPLSLGMDLGKILFRNQIERLHPVEARPHYTGRYELVNPSGARNSDPPIAGDFITVNEEASVLELRNPKGQSLYFVRDQHSQGWEDTAREVELTFSRMENTLLLRVVKDGHQWQWQKMRGGD